MPTWRPSVLLALASAGAWGQTAQNVLLVVNQNSSVSRRIGEYYVHKRGVPLANVCQIHTTAEEEISRAVYDAQVEAPIARCLLDGRLADKILYLVTTLEAPLKIADPIQAPAGTTAASVDSELALLYSKLKGVRIHLPGVTRNPFYGRAEAKFGHPQFPIYLVTRLAGYDFEDVRGLIDRAQLGVNRGMFVIDLKGLDASNGNDWLREAAKRLPAQRVLLEETGKVLYGVHDVLGYASWGSNDGQRTQRRLGFEWRPGAIMTEFVSFNARTFKRPPVGWNITPHWREPASFYAGAPQTLTADYIHEGVTGASGHVYEPFLSNTPRPEVLLSAYFNGRDLAQSYYLAIPSLSWMNVVIGDPLCRLK